MIKFTKLQITRRKCLFISKKMLFISHNFNKNCDNNDKINNDKGCPPEAPTNCCMQGCPNCVWVEYAEKLRDYYLDGGKSAIKEINEKIEDPNIKAFILHELRMKNIK